jgi:hypothetical protein
MNGDLRGCSSAVVIDRDNSCTHIYEVNVSATDPMTPCGAKYLRISAKFLIGPVSPIVRGEFVQ